MNTLLRVSAPLIAIVIVVAACSRNSTDNSAPAGDSVRSRYAGPLPALPPVAFELPRPREVVQAVYYFAGRRPDVLQYVPCFCGCQNSGHVGNDDCFVSSRDASGKPAWDTHGMG